MSAQTSTTQNRIHGPVTACLTGMLGFVAAGLTVAAPAVAGPPPAPASVTVPFVAVGETAFRVPAGVESLHVVAVGGHGGRSLFGLGGSGATVEADLSVTPEDVLYIEVAGDGGDLTPGYRAPGATPDLADAKGGVGGVGFGAGGEGAQGWSFDPIGGGVFFAGGGGGGGASAIVSCPVSDSSCDPVPLVVAGGGGGGGYNSVGGDGGTPDGASGGGTGAVIPLHVIQLGGEGGQQDRPGACPVEPRLCPVLAAPRDGGKGIADLGGSGLSILGAGGGGGGYFGGGGGRSVSFGPSAAQFVGGGGGGGSSLVPDGGAATVDQGDAAASVTISYLLPDTTMPTLSVPADLTVEATSSLGAVVPFTVSATDSGGAGLTVLCDSPAGSTFPLGRTDVTCTATGSNGITAQRTFSVGVQDTTPPLVASHDDVAATWTDGNAVVDYPPPTATDAVDGDVPVTCLPASGERFPLGETTVTCLAIDTAGNRASSTFTVRVTAPSVQVPGPPAIGPATAGNGSASVAFTQPSSTGGAPVSGYLVTASPGGRTATGTTSPITVPGLTNGTSYRFTVQAISSAGNSPFSAPSNAVTPAAWRANADVRVVVSGPASVPSGRTATYTVTVTNVGPATATGLVALLDTSGLSRTSTGVAPSAASTSVVAFSPGDYRWTLGPLAPGASVRLRVTGTVSARAGQPAGARAAAWATPADPNMRNNTARLGTRVTVR